jgi:hypothetical protein
MTWFTVRECLCHRWPRTYSICRSHNLVLSHRKLKIEQQEPVRKYLLMQEVITVQMMHIGVCFNLTVRMTSYDYPFGFFNIFIFAVLWSKTEESLHRPVISPSVTKISFHYIISSLVTILIEWRIYTVAISEVMMAIVKHSGWWFNIQEDLVHELSGWQAPSLKQLQTLEYSINWEMNTPLAVAARM